jgi:hypothetical protein
VSIHRKTIAYPHGERSSVTMRRMEYSGGIAYDRLAGCGKRPPAAFSHRSEAQRTAWANACSHRRWVGEKVYDSPLRSLRPCLWRGASWRAGVGRVRTAAFLRILHGDSTSSHASISVTVTQVNMSFSAAC